MSNLIVCGDNHFKIEEPFFLAGSDFLDWVIEQEWNNSSNSLFLLGDVFHRAVPNPKVIGMVYQKFQKLKFKTIYILAGNHDYNRSKNSFSGDALTSLENVVYIKKPKIFTINGLSILSLPFFYEGSNELGNMKEYYENLPEELSGKTDYIFGHFPNKDLFGHKIDISYLKGKPIMGDVHIRADDYIGVPVITRYDEKGQEGILISINADTKEETVIKVPKFLDYETIDYSEGKKETTTKHTIYDIENCPSIKEAYKKYKDLHVRKISTILNIDTSKKIKNDFESKKEDIGEYLDAFCKEKKIDKKIATKLKQILSRKEVT